MDSRSPGSREAPGELESLCRTLQDFEDADEIEEAEALKEDDIDIEEGDSQPQPRGCNRQRCLEFRCAAWCCLLPRSCCQWRWPLLCCKVLQRLSGHPEPMQRRPCSLRIGVGPAWKASADTPQDGTALAAAALKLSPESASSESKQGRCPVDFPVSVAL